ncbi:MAG: hypothetical protein MI864_28290 [Pseudomonadales bacterium]|nr:hypothetical protein [Pseudomonadales bacterium]
MMNYLSTTKKNTGYLTVFLISSFFTGTCSAQLLASELLEDDVLVFDSDTLQPADSGSWWDRKPAALKLSAEQLMSQAPGNVAALRTRAGLEYEDAFYPGWFFRLDIRYTYYWRTDREAERNREDYGELQTNDLWVQYSQNDCNLKVGRQTLIWGEVEGTFAVDIVSPFDYTELLLTDFNEVRLAQDMLVGACFFGQVQTQIFFTPEALTDVYRHRGKTYDEKVGSEWGGRLKWLWTGGDITFSYARLYSNQPILVLPSYESSLSRFHFLGLSSSIAIRRLLFKLDIGYKTDQKIPFTAREADTLDIAAGVEYTTATNHNFNIGVWTNEYIDDDADLTPEHYVTFGWNKLYLNDDLTMSALVNWSKEPKAYGGTLLSQYKWDDYISTDLALSWSEYKDANQNTNPEKAITLKVKVVF